MDTLLEKAKNIKLVALDVDGILTSGVIYYGPDQLELKGFHIRDGIGIKFLTRFGIQVALISGKTSKAVEARAADLGITHLYLGYEHKLAVYEKLKTDLQLTDEEIAYAGDDLLDLPLLKRVGFAVTVPEAPELLLQDADFITKNPGGAGAVRELCDFILKAQDKYTSMVQFYLNQ